MNTGVCGHRCEHRYMEISVNIGVEWIGLARGHGLGCPHVILPL